MTDAPIYEYDERLIGLEQEVGSIEITAERVASYCEAVGETNPRYLGGEVVPPSFICSLRFDPGPDPRLRFGNATFHGGVHLTLLEPVKVGDTVTSWAQVKEVYAKTGRSGSMVFLLRRHTYRNQDGDDVGYADHTWVYRQIGE